MMVLLSLLAPVWLVLCSWIAERLWGAPPFFPLDRPHRQRAVGACPVVQEDGSGRP